MGSFFEETLTNGPAYFGAVSVMKNKEFFKHGYPEDGSNDKQQRML
jgi:hypothetical protein